jgi:hypothetical protein
MKEVKLIRMLEIGVVINSGEIPVYIQAKGIGLLIADLKKRKVESKNNFTLTVDMQGT